MSRKKINFKIQKEIVEILEKDAQYFGLSKEGLCNRIFEEFIFKQLNFEALSSDEEENDIYIQFNLNKKNSLIYKDITKKEKNKIDSKYFRKILTLYSNLNEQLREKIIFRRTYELIKKCIKDNNLLRVYYLEKIHVVQPTLIMKNPLNSYNTILVESKSINKIPMSKLEIINTLNK